MKKILVIGLSCMMTFGLMMGCASSNKETEAPETESVIVNTETEGQDLESVAMHTIFLHSKDGQYLFMDEATQSMFFATMPEDLTDAEGHVVNADDLKIGNKVDIYGDQIMLMSYPGQYPGVTKMVVTAEGSEEEVVEFIENIEQFFPETVDMLEETEENK